MMSGRYRTACLARATSSSSRTLRKPLRPRLATFSSCRPLGFWSRRDERSPAVVSAVSDPLTAYTPPPPPPLNNPSRASDDLIKAHFDLPYPTSSTSSPPSGLFLLQPLHSPTSLPPLTDRTLIHARHLVQRICAAPSDPSGRELRLVVKNLDRLSDLLCGVIDMCELVRNVHPDEDWIVEAEKAYERLCSFMNELNTNKGLYKVSAPTIICNSLAEREIGTRCDAPSSLCQPPVHRRDSSRPHFPPRLREVGDSPPCSHKCAFRRALRLPPVPWSDFPLIRLVWTQPRSSH